MILMFEKEKETKNTVRFTEVLDEDHTTPVVGTLYVQKSAMKELNNASLLRVEIEVPK